MTRAVRDRQGVSAGLSAQAVRLEQAAHAARARSGQGAQGARAAHSVNGTLVARMAPRPKTGWALALAALVFLLALAGCGGAGGNGDAAATTASGGTGGENAATGTADGGNAEGSGGAALQAGAAGASGGLSGVNEFPISAEKITMSAFIAPNALIENIETNEFTKWYEEKTNVHIEWDAVPQQARLERLNLILAADDLPEIIFGASVTKDDEMVYGPAGKFIDLTPYIEKHGYYIKEMYEKVPYVLSGITAADGMIYSLPQVNECFHCMYDGTRNWINSKLQGELGLKTPTTTEEFREYLRSLKSAGMIPYSGSKPDAGYMNRLVAFLANAFIYTDPFDGLLIVDGEVQAAYARPEFREALKYINSLYAEGLIDPAAFTQTDDELKQTVENPDGNRVGVASSYYFGSLASLEGERHKEFDILYPVAGPEGVQYTHYNPYRQSTGQFVVTNRAKNVDAAVKWADYLFSDDAAVRYIECGREGYEWRRAEDGELDFYDRPAARARIDTVAYAETTNVHYYQTGPSFRSFDYRESWFRGAGDMYGKDAYEWRLHVYTLGQTKYRPDMKRLRVYPPVYTTEADSRELKRITSNIKDQRTLYVDAFATGQRDIDAEWDAYIAGLEAVELPLYLEIKQRAYDASLYKDSIPEPGNPDAPIKFDDPVNK
jgi:putative aldouronate transport system substrate-binding protein